MSWKALALLATGAAGVRLVYLLAFARTYTPRSDANHYQAIGKAFAQGDGIAGIFPFTFQHPTAFRPPLYPALLGAVYWITGVHVADWYGEIRAQMVACTMPPVDAGLAMSLAERQKILSWIRCGFPK